MTITVDLPHPSEWGHPTPAITPLELVEALGREIQVAIARYLVLPEGPIPCDTAEGYSRFAVEIPLTQRLFGQFMNGAAGYRAHYAVSIEAGEAFNRQLVEAVGRLVVDAGNVYPKSVDCTLLRRSLLGSYSKFWYSKEITDPSSTRLSAFKEEIAIRRWKKFWANKEPRMGLLAPYPESFSVLLNGTFVNGQGNEYENKPGRSKEIYETGWT